MKFSKDSITALATLAADINENVENIGARRLHTVLERLLEDISFEASEKGGETITISAKDMDKRVGELAKQVDVSKFIL